MEGKISIYIKNRKAYYGKDTEYNTIIIDRTEIKNKEYREKILKRIIRLVETKPMEYKLPRERKVIEKENTTPVGTGFNMALIGIIKRNENARRELERVKQILKDVKNEI